jgi:hypothetical protein
LRTTKGKFLPAQTELNLGCFPALVKPFFVIFTSSPKKYLHGRSSVKNPTKPLWIDKDDILHYSKFLIY